MLPVQTVTIISSVFTRAYSSSFYSTAPFNMVRLLDEVIPTAVIDYHSFDPITSHFFMGSI